MEYKSVGSHSKSDWVLYKKSAPEVEVYASRNDALNLTVAPAALMSALEKSTEYIIKVRYYDATNDIWSDWGELEFVTADVFNAGSLKFTMRADGDEIYGVIEPLVSTAAFTNTKKEVFHHYSGNEEKYEEDINTSVGKDVCMGDLYINNVLSNDRLEVAYFMDSLEADQGLGYKNVKKDDVVEFVLKTPSEGFIVPNNTKAIKYIKDFLTPLPKPVRIKDNQAQNGYFQLENVTSLQGAFANTFIESIPVSFTKNCTLVTNFTDLFRNNTALKSVPARAIPLGSTNNILVTSMFRGCTSIESIGENIFLSYSGDISVSEIFMECSGLKTVSKDVFHNLSKLANVNNAFNGCTSLNNAEIDFTQVPHINLAENFAAGCPTPIIVYVKTGSTTAQTFKNTPSANVNVVEK